MRPIKVLSTFDGIACGRVALQRAGIPVKRYFASEIDKHAIKIAIKNYPDIIQLGSVTDIRYESGGEDTGLSFSDGYYNCEDSDGIGIDLLIGGSPCQGFSFAGKQLNFDDPRSKLLFEFVRLLKEIRVHNPDVKFLLENVKMKKEYQDIISELLGVQPIAINSALVSAQNRKRLYWTNISDKIEQPEDKGLFLNSILIDKSFCDRSKSYAIDASYHKKNIGDYANRARGQVCFIDYEAYSELCKKQLNKNSKTANEKALALTTNSNTTGSGVTILDYGNKRYRKLLPIECERLQTLPDNYTEGISDTQRYRCVGNGWNIDTIVHLLKYYKL
jgi:DNA-cytosine methyltransferase